MEQRLSLISLGVADLSRSRRFYEDGLGWHPHESSNDEIVFVPLNSIVLGLYGWDGLAKDAGIAAAGDGFRGIALAHNTRTQDDVDRVLKRAEDAGGTLIKSAQTVFWGGYSGYFADPDGHLYEVAYNPFWQINPAGDVIMTNG